MKVMVKHNFNPSGPAIPKKKEKKNPTGPTLRKEMIKLSIFSRFMIFYFFFFFLMSDDFLLDLNGYG